jgi:uncharacterized protein YhbP (UPF0306 family)
MIRQSKRRFSSRRLAEVVRELLDASTLCALSTVSREGRAHVNAMYFAWDDVFRIVWISDRGAGHSHNLAENRSAGVMVYDSRQKWGGSDRGIQLFGTARRVEGSAARAAEAVYARRFPRYHAAGLASYDFFVFRPSRLKAFDETAFGSGTFVTARVSSGGRLQWVKTELYSGA